MKTWKIFYILLALTLFPFKAQGDGYNPNEDWKVISTKHFNVLYMKSAEKEAQRTANLLELAFKYNMKTMPVKHWSKVDVILSSRSAEANGYVANAPLYSNFYNGEMAFSSLEWLETLAIHEGRHILQTQRLKDTGGKRFLYFLGGQSYMQMISGLFTPAWFWEGDAVAMETALTLGGRGRRAFFNMEFRALELEGIRYSYYRNYLGRKDDQRAYPNHYVLGYQMVSYARRHYKADVWSKTLGGTLTYLFGPTFDRALMWQTDGKDMQDIYEAALDELKTIWKEQQKHLVLTPYKKENQEEKYLWEAYLAPKVMGEKLYALNFNKNKGTFLVELKKGKTKRMEELPAGVISGFFSAEKSASLNANKVAWIASKADIRWNSEQYANIYIYDIKADETKRLTSKGKYTSVAISPDGLNVAAIKLTKERKHFIEILNTKTGKVVKRKEIKSSWYDLSWSDDGSEVLAIQLDASGMALVALNTKNGDILELLPASFDAALRSPISYGKYVLYQSDYSGIDNVFALDTTTGEQFMVTSSKYGAFFPAVNKHQLYYSDYTTMGYDVVSMHLDETKWLPLKEVKVLRENYFEPYAKQEGGNILTPENKQAFQTYQTENYYPLWQSLNIHSWGFLVDTESVNLKISSKDSLGVLGFNLGGGYDWKTNTKKANASLEYNQWYPIFSLGGNYQHGEVNGDDKKAKAIQENRSVSFGISIPLNFSEGKYYNQLTLGVIGSFEQVSRDLLLVGKDLDTEGKVLPITYQAQLMIAKQRAQNAIRTRLGFLLQASYQHMPIKDWSDYQAELLLTSGSIFLPGFYDTHSIKIDGSYMKTFGDESYHYTTGYTTTLNEKDLSFDDYIYARVGYKLPVFYTSFNIWKLLYFRGLNMELFADGGLSLYEDKREKSAGVGLDIELPINPFSNLNLILKPTFTVYYDLYQKEPVFRFNLAVGM